MTARVILSEDELLWEVLESVAPLHYKFLRFAAKNLGLPPASRRDMRYSIQPGRDFVTMEKSESICTASMRY